MAEDGKGAGPEGRDSRVPGMLENWGTQTKTARPESVGPHHAREDQENPADPGIRPEAGYKPGPGTNEGNAGPGKSEPATGESTVITPGVKEATDIKPGPERDAPPLTGLVD
ncbi:hypothetical protein VQH23_17665 [Pararoseomonas sp. SCSIO 73927]|uniref:hypothetical protein n=1 Tax=Pararoseomonas sp. SCSIO 73927 TaxID=3114537 RepID=UPI0030CB34D7